MNTRPTILNEDLQATKKQRVSGLNHDALFASIPTYIDTPPENYLLGNCLETCATRFDDQFADFIVNRYRDELAKFITPNTKTFGTRKNRNTIRNCFSILIICEAAIKNLAIKTQDLFNVVCKKINNQESVTIYAFSTSLHTIAKNHNFYTVATNGFIMQVNLPRESLYKYFEGVDLKGAMKFLLEHLNKEPSIVKEKNNQVIDKTDTNNWALNLEKISIQKAYDISYVYDNFQLFAENFTPENNIDIALLLMIDLALHGYMLDEYALMEMAMSFTTRQTSRNDIQVKLNVFRNTYRGNIYDSNTNGHIISLIDPTKLSEFGVMHPELTEAIQLLKIKLNEACVYFDDELDSINEIFDAVKSTTSTINEAETYPNRTAGSPFLYTLPPELSAQTNAQIGTIATPPIGNNMFDLKKI